MTYRIKMIRMKGHRLSEAYASYVLPSWEDFPGEVEMFDAVTEENLYESEVFWDVGFANVLVSHVGMEEYIKKHDSYPGVSKREAATYCSFITLWKECIEENVPYLIIEHDALYVGPKNFELPESRILKISSYANAATLYSPEWCRDFLENGAFSMPYTDIVNFSPEVLTHNLNYVVPVLDLKHGTTIPEHAFSHGENDHMHISLGDLS